MNGLVQDVRYAFRQLLRSPGFTATAILTLALGIGANTAAFTLMYGILLRPLPVPNPGQLYRIGNTDPCCEARGFPSPDGDFPIFSYDLYLNLKNSSPRFESLGAVNAGMESYSLRQSKSAAQNAVGQFVSGNYFTALQVTPYMGRMFSESDDNIAANQSPVLALVLSYPAWKNQFGSDPSIIGSTIFVNTHPFTVVGVTPRGFYSDRITEDSPGFYVTLASEPLLLGGESKRSDPNKHWLYLIGRVRPGTDIASLQTQVTGSLQQWLYSRPEYTTPERKGQIPKQHVVIAPATRGIEQMSSRYSPGLKLLMLLSTVVLLIACANIANLLMVRGIARRAEMSLRVALGASRRRLIRQIFVECLLLSCLGGLAGVALAYLSSLLILALTFADSLDFPVHAAPSLTVLGFAFLVTLATGLIFGTAPAQFSLRIQPAEVMRGVNHSTRGLSMLPQKILVVLQSALTLVLLVGALLTARSLYNLGHQNLVLSTENRYIVHLNPATAGYTPERLPALYSNIQTSFAALGGVNGVGLAGYSFLEGWNLFDCVVLPGQAIPQDRTSCYTSGDYITPGYLELIGIPILKGREFTNLDKDANHRVVIVNESFARRYFPKGNALGNHFNTLGGIKSSTNFEIVGICKDFKTFSPRGDIRPLFLEPLLQRKVGAYSIDSVLIRFKHTPDNADSLLRHTLAKVDPNLSADAITSMDEQIAGTLSQERLIARLAIVLGFLAVTLASVGLYGVTSYIVVQRTSEIGIRMALGSSRLGIIRLILLGVLLQIGLGLALGIPCALLAGFFMKSLLYELKWYDPVGLIAATLFLNLCAVAAAFIPARRAATIQPMQALRIE